MKRGPFLSESDKQGFGQDNPDISPDDKWVIYSAWIDGGQRILRVPLLGGEAQQLTNFQSTEPRYSPDGTQFACFIMNEATQSWHRMSVHPADGGEALKTFDLPTEINETRGRYGRLMAAALPSLSAAAKRRTCGCSPSTADR